MVKFTSKANLEEVGKQMKNNKLKICSFYVSEWHLTAMLLPFIEEQAEKEKNLNTIFEKNIAFNMKEILTRVQISEKTKEKIMKIDWKNKKLIKYAEIRRYMDKITRNQKETIVIIEGKKDRIECINRNIDRWMERQSKKLQRKEIIIINCYEVGEFNENLQEILDKHDKVLNTAGIHEIQEMYTGYVKKRA